MKQNLLAALLDCSKSFFKIPPCPEREAATADFLKLQNLVETMPEPEAAPEPPPAPEFYDKNNPPPENV